MKLAEVAKLGDYVDYDTLISREKSFEEIPREHMNWRVLKNDGRNVTIISEKPTQNEICLEGAYGYRRGSYWINKILSELYSSEVGKARNLKIEDVNELLEYKADKIRIYDKEVPYGARISELEKMFHKKLECRQTPEGKDVGEYGQTYYWYRGAWCKRKCSTEYQLVFGKADEYRYWLSSSCTNAYYLEDIAVFADFNMRSIEDGAVDADTLYRSYNYDYSVSHFARPIVFITSSVCVTNEQAGGKTADTAWKIQ